MSRIACIFLVALLLPPVTSKPAPAQNILPAALGGAVGVTGGTVVTLSIVVARARFQHEYLDSVDDLIHWQSVPMIVAPATGVLFGFAGWKALEGSVLGATTGALAGAALGAGVGWMAATTPESPWAGGVIGAGLGLTVGGILGGLRAWSRDEDPGIKFPGALRFGLSLPVR